MSKDQALIIRLQSALESNERLDASEASRALDKLKQLQHSLKVKNHKRAQQELEQFTRELVDIFQS